MRTEVTYGERVIMTRDCGEGVHICEGGRAYNGTCASPDEPLPRACIVFSGVLLKIKRPNSIALRKSSITICLMEINDRDLGFRTHLKGYLVGTK